MNTTPVSPKAFNLTPLKAFTGVFLAVFLCVFGGSALITFLLPETFVSVARVRIAAAEQAGNFQSPATLGAVAEQLDLNRALGQQYGERKPLPTERTVDLLRRSLLVAPVRGTNLVEIRVYNHSPTEAARLANAIAQTGIAGITTSTTNS
ncbi:MAG TPA: hypothetical protein VNT26_11660, partial [Candidatus Sulfotelmatobacter sp.]|nr:hypothetical protein [Candidatus Sulfotelmatobacter sp.]